MGRIVVLGESLGTGVVVSVAATHPVHALVLDSAYSSTEDVAASRYWMFPVRFLMLDMFRSIDRIAEVHAPKLFLHGADDPIIPVVFGRKLFEAASPPETFLEYKDRGHTVLWIPGVQATMEAWLAEPASWSRHATPGR